MTKYSEYSITISKVDNGYICSSKTENGADAFIPTKHYVIEEDEDLLNGDHVAMAFLLRYIKEFFGCYYSKHNKSNVVIGVKEPSEE